MEDHLTRIYFLGLYILKETELKIEIRKTGLLLFLEERPVREKENSFQKD